jgi:hypothetical protein
MRLKVGRLWRAIKQELPLQFGHEQLTSYGGLELVRGYFQLIELKARMRRALVSILAAITAALTWSCW